VRGDRRLEFSVRESLEEFRHLAHDLEQYCAEFLVGSDSEFLAVAAQAEAAKQIRGFKSPVISCLTNAAADERAITTSALL